MIEVTNETYNGHTIAVAHHNTHSKQLVIFCHGYRGSSIGPSRNFVRVAQMLEEAGISSLRFDQYGSGNSDGDFYESSFNDWIATTRAITEQHLAKGHQVILFGQSMGAAAVIAAGADLRDITAVVAWVPDPSVDDLILPKSGFMEEGGQRVQSAFWKEAHEVNVADKLAGLKANALIIQCTGDEYVDAANRAAIAASAQPNHSVLDFEGYTHSSWTYDQAEPVLQKSVDFIVRSFRQSS